MPAPADRDADENHAAWPTAYWEWKSNDPHVRAYDVLLLKQSQEIVRLLNLDEPQFAKLQTAEDKKLYLAFIQKTCCGCHATGVDLAQNARPHSDSLALGVHCEACHGPAGNWVHEHTLDSWTSLTVKQREAQGHRTTRDLASRAKICAECHIGSSDTPGREVNHDLIAAGHPRLNFEYTVHLANIPKHWNEKIDRKWAVRPRPQTPQGNRPSKGIARSNFELEAWEVGQLVSAEQALKLLVGRASRAVSKVAAPQVEGAAGMANGDVPVWPEFAEYDCFACHHDLGPYGFRQAKSHGEWKWGNWYTALADGWLPAPNSLAQLQELLEKPAPLPKDVLDVSQKLLEQVSAAVANRPTIPVNQRLSDFAKALASSDLPKLGWMEAAQWSLAVTSCVEAYKPGQVDGLDGRLQSLQELQEWLAFSASPAEKGGEKRAGKETDQVPNNVPGKSLQLNSPKTFDPTDTDYLKLIRQIRKDLIQLANAATPKEPEAER